MTTVHADSPRGALEQIALMAMQARVNLSRADILTYAHSVIDIVVQLSRVGGKRRIEGVSFVDEELIS
jgi:type IV secretion system protein VirB11